VIVAKQGKRKKEKSC